ncbi:MAG: non-ribosomal peptide synthetase, partial [bacterium]|nr:non-ribosomal peptide synthetase [bacterium]
EALREELPAHMVPSAFIVLDSLPRNPSGKVDRRAQPAPSKQRSEAELRGVPQAPRDRLELALVRIWEDLLGIEPIGVTEDFFALGGHSLLTLRLQRRIAQLTCQRLSVANLFQAPTIEKQAAILRRREQSAPACLVPLRASGSRPPLFCIHAAGGHVACYHALARHLGSEQPVYGLQAAGLEGGGLGPETFEGMAAAYLDELRVVQPAGPYHLAGWSIGGVVAFEMARQLRRQQQEVALLALLDTRAPVGVAAVDEVGLLVSFALHLGIP